ncbi:hypothetical protein BT69DRAFT_1283392 [Atractiella rhizophila]|nr:hypothetical protein BT69DRAFT_1283392 [Atractiella rhizophila]
MGEAEMRGQQAGGTSVLSNSEHRGLEECLLMQWPAESNANIPRHEAENCVRNQVIYSLPGTKEQESSCPQYRSPSVLK